MSDLRAVPDSWLFPTPITPANRPATTNNPPATATIDTEALQTLMNLVAALDPRDGDLTAGITYIGQMISHDIIPPTRKDSDTRPLLTNKTISPNLNLESIYGDGDFQANPKTLHQGRFRLGTAENGASASDLVRTDAGVHIADSRNDENIIVSQLHLFWQKFHNKVFDTYLDDMADQQKAFKLTRDFVIAIFHRIVVDEYLFQLLRPEIYLLYCQQKQSFLLTEEMTDIPNEFSFAAFRIGHSMVRAKYKLQQDGANLTLSQLFIKPNDHSKPIKASQVVDWHLLFGRASQGYRHSQNASKIDLKLTDALRNVPAMGSFGGVNLIAANLAAALHAKLDPGYSYLEKIKQHPALEDAAKMATCKKPNYQASPLQGWSKTLLVETLPLWAYILIENDASEDIDWQFIGHTETHLGKVGSIMIAEVLMKSMAQVAFDPDLQPFLDKFYYRIGHSSRPSSGHAVNNTLKDHGSRLSMLDLVHFVGFS